MENRRLTKFLPHKNYYLILYRQKKFNFAFKTYRLWL